MCAYKILLADEQEIFRQGIRNVIGQIENTQICGEADNGHELIELSDKASPNLIVMGIDLPTSDGLKILDKIKKNNPEVRYLILTNTQKRNLIISALKYGVDGFIFKHEPSTDLLQAVQIIRDGGKYFSPLFSTELVRFIKMKNEIKPLISPREKEIMQCMGDGMRSRDIAETLNLSLNTVQRYRYYIRKKMNMKHMTELVQYCILNKSSL